MMMVFCLCFLWLLVIISCKKRLDFNFFSFSTSANRSSCISSLRFREVLISSTNFCICVRWWFSVTAFLVVLNEFRMTCMTLHIWTKAFDKYISSLTPRGWYLWKISLQYSSRDCAGACLRLFNSCFKKCWSGALLNRLFKASTVLSYLVAGGYGQIRYWPVSLSKMERFWLLFGETRYWSQQED